MTLTVVDNTNLEQIVAESGEQPVEANTLAEQKAPEVKTAEEKTTDEVKTEPKADDTDDEEGEDGLTARQKRELSEKMLKTIGKKHRQMKEAEEFAAHKYREAMEAERRATEAENRLRQIEAQNKPAPAKEAVEPQRQDFATETEFIDARVKWGVDQGIKQREAERIEAERVASVQAQFQKAAQLVPDFEAVTSKQLNYPGAVVEYMRDSPMFAELGYYFGKNPEALAKLGTLKPVIQLVEVGKIVAKLQPFGSEKTTEAAEKANDNGKASQAAPSTVDTGLSPSKARSNAPVIKPLSSSDGQTVQPDVRDMNTRQMIEEFQKSKGVNLNARKRH